MRRTKVTQIYKKTGNLRAVQLLLGHAKMDSTVRYLGVELEDALAISEAIEILEDWAVRHGRPIAVIDQLVGRRSATSPNQLFMHRAAFPKTE